MAKMLSIKDPRVIGLFVIVLGSLYVAYRMMVKETFINDIPSMKGYNQYVDEMIEEHDEIKEPNEEHKKMKQMLIVPQGLYDLSKLWRKNIAYQDDMLEDDIVNSIVKYQKIPKDFHKDHTRANNNDMPLLLEMIEVEDPE
jgi:hypothetical protein